jgi:hypothetical protein
VHALQDEFFREVRDKTQEVNPYMTLEQIEQLLENKLPDVPVEALTRYFHTNFLEKNPEFNRSLFHYLLNRLGRHRDSYALEYCLTNLADHPEESSHMLKYVNMVGASDGALERLERFLRSRDCIYEYQTYQILAWIGDQEVVIGESLFALIRDIAFDRRQPDFVRSVARQIVGSRANVGDLDRIERSFAEAVPGFEQAQVLCALGRMERGRRNSFFARQQGNDWCARAGRLVRSRD